MKSKDFVLSTMKKYGKMMAENLQEKAPEMSGTELYAEDSFIPAFNPKRQYLNFKVGYVCKSKAGRLVKLIQPYDSTVYTQQPEELVAHWGFYWSKDPKKALPFIALSTSPYMDGDCCTDEGLTYRSRMDNNVYRPKDYPEGWELVTE